FFFSSRRRHTRWPRDWSSDVCSSDLYRSGNGPRAGHSYELIDQHADHYHFDTGKGWGASRAQTDGSPATASDELGGGHAHAGLRSEERRVGKEWRARRGTDR